MNKSAVRGTEPVFSFLTLQLGLVPQEFLREIVEDVLRHRKRVSSAAAVKLGEALGRIPFPGFRNASTAPIRLLADNVMAWCTRGRGDWWLRLVLTLWMDHHAALRDAARALVKRLSGELTFNLAVAPGFLGVWEPAQLEDWTRQLEQLHPGSRREDLRLMLSCVAGRVLIPVEHLAELQRQENSMLNRNTPSAVSVLPPADDAPENPWRQCLEAAQALPAEAPEWAELDIFISELSAIAATKTQEREARQAQLQARQKLKEALEALKASCADELQFFSFADAQTWAADALEPTIYLQAAPMVERLTRLLLEHHQLNALPAARTLDERRTRTERINKLEDDATALYRELSALLSGPPKPPDGTVPPSPGSDKEAGAAEAALGSAALEPPPPPETARALSVEPLVTPRLEPQEDAREAPSSPPRQEPPTATPAAVVSALPEPFPATLPPGEPAPALVAPEPAPALVVPEPAPALAAPEPLALAPEPSLPEGAPRRQVITEYLTLGLERLELLDTAGAFILLEASNHSPSLPWLVLLTERAFKVPAPTSERLSAPELDEACARAEAAVSEWTYLDLYLGGLVCTSLVVLDGLSSPPAHQLFQIVREKMRSPPPAYLDPFFRFWDIAHKPVVALRKLLEDERSLEEQRKRAVEDALEALQHCRMLQFNFSLGNRFIAKVFPPTGGRFAWIEGAVQGSDLNGALILNAEKLEELRQLSPDDFIDHTCAEFGKNNKKIDWSARVAIRQRMLDLRDRVGEWEAVVRALLGPRTRSGGTTFFREHLLELAHKCTALRLAEPRNAQERVLNAVAQHLLARGRKMLGDHP